MKKIISAYKENAGVIMIMIGIVAGIITPLQMVHAQNIQLRKPDWCPSVPVDLAALKRAKAFESNNNRSLLNTHYLLRVYFHIIRDDDGSNAGFTAAEVDCEFSQLSVDYAAYNICFANMGLDYINSTTLNAMNKNDQSSISLLASHNVPGCINIYYHREIIGAGGSSYIIPNTYCSVKRHCDQTTSHEVGHCLGLLHTFETVFGYEDINGSNSGTAGDGVTDTPADPYAYSAQPCFSQASCVYTGNCTDPVGQSNFTPPYTNLMAYWQCSFQHITPFQYNRITGYLNTFPALINCESPQNANYGPVNFTSGYQIATATDLFTTNGNVNLHGSAIASFVGGTVILNPGFHAYPSSVGSVLVGSVSCNFAPIHAATSKTVNKELALTNQTLSLTCLPNPANSYVTISYQLHVSGNTSITFFDITGKAVKVIQPNSLLAAGRYENKVYLGSIHSGMYFVKMIYNGRAYVTKLIVVK
jgi:hypothetical protein